MEYVCEVLRDGLSRFSGHELEHFVEKRQRYIDRIEHPLNVREVIGVALYRVHRSRKVGFRLVAGACILSYGANAAQQLDRKGGLCLFGELQ